MINAININNYSDRLIHKTAVDFNHRIVSKPVFIMQYDKTLPIIEATLLFNGQPYYLPDNASVTMRWGKPDKTFSIIEPIGCDSTRQKLYFEVTENMAYFYGDHNPIIELVIGDMQAGTSYILVTIEKNPVQITDIKSTNEYIALDKAVKESQDAVEYLNQYKDAIVEESTEIIDQKTQEAVQQISSAINTFEVGADNQEKPSNNLILGGIFYKKI